MKSTETRRTLSATPTGILLALALIGACAGAPPREEPRPPPPPDAPPPPPVAVVPSASAAPSAAPPVEKPPEGPTACPAGMVLIEGDYCPQVEHKCKKEWYAAANKKRVCEDFEEKATCVGEKRKMRYCIDKYEWPNVQGERPEVMNRFHQAQVKCAAVGKRMCRETEWNLACEGPEMKPFPYGWKRDPLVCNGDHKWDDPNMDLVGKRDARELGRLWRGMRSGTQPGCKSDFGVYDLPGNADEVVSAEADPKLGFGILKRPYDSVHTGGPWYKGVRNQCRPKVYTHAEDFYYYFLSFRCCAEADQKPTDPRTQWQQRDGWSMEKVERSAQFTVAQMKEKLELKKQGKCSCGERDILCKTMCGTLLGPNAEDVTTATPRAAGP
jgi:sulfatase modifying factor 1